MRMYRAVLALREHREHRKLTQDQLAARSGVGVATIRRIETMDRPAKSGRGPRAQPDPPLSLIAKLASALDVHPRRLLDWTADQVATK